MYRIAIFGVTLAGVIFLVSGACSQPPGKEKGGSGGKEGKGFGKEGKGAPGKDGMPLLPPFVRDQLNLTEAQEKELASLEKEFRERLMKLLNKEQQEKLRDFRPKGKDGPPPKKDDGEFPPPKKDGGKEPLSKNEGTKQTGAIAWYSTLNAGLQEATRTGKPILFLTAAPHCAGISGIW